MKHQFLAATAAIALIALTPAAFAQTATGANGAQYGDPNNGMAEGSQNTNGALSGQAPGDIGTGGSSETHSYSGADLNNNINGAMSLQSNGSLNNGSNLSAIPNSAP
jgi:hypothetical protein